MLAASAYLTMPRDVQLSAVAEREFFQGIETSNGTKKTTAVGRLAAMDELFFATLSRLNMVPRTVMDVGASSGVTTVEWLREFERRGFNIKMIATDLVMSVYIYTIGRFIKAMTERNGYILQIELFGIGVRTYTRWRDYILGGLIWRTALCAFVRSRLSRSVREGPYYFVSPLLRNNSHIQLLYLHHM